MRDDITLSVIVVHTTASRSRFRIPRLAEDPVFVAHLLQQIHALTGITAARVNSLARSLIVHHEPNVLIADLHSRITEATKRAATLSLSGQLPSHSWESEAKLSASGAWPAIGWVLLATGSYATLQAVIRFITGSLHPFQIVFLTNLLAVGLLLPVLAGDGLSTTKLPLHGLRAILDAGASLLLVSGLSLLPLAQVNALGATTPLFAMVGASLVLGEALRPQRWVSLLLGMVGMLVIVRPGLAGIGLGALLTLGGSIAFAGVVLLLKVLSRTDSSLTIIAYNALLLTPLTFIPALWVWTVPTLGELALLAVAAALGLVGQICMFQALEQADATTVLPADFAQFVWASALGFVLFQEVPDLWTWLGGLLIFAGVIGVANSEPEEQDRALLLEST